MNVVTMWCEWEIGCEYGVFATLEAAHKAANRCLNDCGIYDDELTCLQDVIDAGFIGFNIKKVIE